MVSYKLFYLLKNVFQQDYFVIKEEKTRKNTISEQINNLKNALNKEETFLEYHRECINNFINYSDLKNYRNNEIRSLKTIDTIKYQLRELEKSLEEDIGKIKEQDDIFTNLTIKDFKTKTNKEKRELVGKIFHSIKVFRDNVLVVSCFTNAHFIFDCKEDERYKDTPARQSIYALTTMVGQSINFKNTVILNNIIMPKKSIETEIKKLIPDISGFPMKIFDFRGFSYPKNIDWNILLKNNINDIVLTNNSITKKQNVFSVMDALENRSASSIPRAVQKGNILDLERRKNLLKMLYTNKSFDI